MRWSLFFRTVGLYILYLALWQCPVSQPLPANSCAGCEPVHAAWRAAVPVYHEHLHQYVAPVIDRTSPFVTPIVQQVHPLVVRVHTAASPHVQKLHSQVVAAVRPHRDAIHARIHDAYERWTAPHREAVRAYYDKHFALHVVAARAHVDSLAANVEKHARPALVRGQKYAHERVWPVVKRSVVQGTTQAWRISVRLAENAQRWVHVFIVRHVVPQYERVVAPRIDIARQQVQERLGPYWDKIPAPIRSGSGSLYKAASAYVKPESDRAVPVPSDMTKPFADLETPAPVKENATEPIAATTPTAAAAAEAATHTPEPEAEPEEPAETAHEQRFSVQPIEFDEASQPESTGTATEQRFSVQPIDIKEDAETETVPSTSTVIATKATTVTHTMSSAEFSSSLAASRAAAESAQNAAEGGLTNEDSMKGDAEDFQAADSESAAPAKPTRAVRSHPVPVGSKVDWIKRVERTTRGALRNLQEDSNVEQDRLIADARPDFMSLLRKLSAYGDEEATSLAAYVGEIEDADGEVEDSLQVYHHFDKRAALLQRMANDVRARAQKLADDAVTAVEKLRTDALEAMDDFFDVVLLEASRETSQAEATGDDDDESNWTSWRDYNKLKKYLKTSRNEFAEHVINLDIVNKALRESQDASVLLAQEFANHFSNLRARAQFLIQQHALKDIRAKEDAGVPFPDHVEDAEYYDATEEAGEDLEKLARLERTFNDVPPELYEEEIEDAVAVEEAAAARKHDAQVSGAAGTVPADKVGDAYYSEDYIEDTDTFYETIVVTQTLQSHSTVDPVAWF